MSGGKKEPEALVFHKMYTEEDSDRDEEGKPNLDDLEMLLDFDFDEVPQTETDLPPMRALAHNISMRYEILEEVRPVIETLAYNDKYRKLLDEIWADKVRLDGMIKPEEEKSMAKMKGKMLKGKKDPGAFTIEQRGRDDIMKEDRNITMINYTEAEVTGRLVNVLCQVRFTTLSAKFLILEIPVDRDAPIVVGSGFLDTIGGNIDIPNRISNSDDEEHVIKRNDMGTTNSQSRPIRTKQYHPAEKHDLTSGTYDHEVGSSRAKRSRNVETVKEALLPDVHHEFLEWRGCSREEKQNEIDQMLKISLKEAQSDEEIFFSVAWVRAFNIREPIYPELAMSFMLSMEFDGSFSLCADDEHQNWVCKGAWVNCKWTMKRKGAGSQKDSQICCGQFISKIARKSKVLIEETIRSLSTLVYYKDLERTTLRELIDSEDRLIPDIPVDDHGDQTRGDKEDGNPPGYAQPQYDQYYQQIEYYPQQPPQQQHDDEEDE
ncbi:hypothetical protein Tco_0894295 [Tanacetum coccineum]|uniref:Uncharacterized protein n=1 Tax=Tanacetum coccineum TaxID=301880 RepID=A0ABQ5CEH9_9ASTR